MTGPAGDGEYPPVPDVSAEGGMIVVWDNGVETSFPCGGAIGPNATSILIGCGWDSDHEILVNVDLLGEPAPGTYWIDSYIKDDYMSLFVITDGAGIFVSANDEADTTFTGTLVIEELSLVSGEPIKVTLQAKWPQARVFAGNQVGDPVDRPGSLAMRFNFVNP